MASKIRVLIADDVAATRENIGKLMEFHPEIEIVGQAGTGAEAVSQAKVLRPDIVLMDINMPEMDGIAATERLTVEAPETSIIIMSVQGEQEYLRRAMMAGAKNYLTKPFTGDELVGAIKQAFIRDQKVRDTARTAAGIKIPGRIISVFSSKGGVGKTTIAANLAVALSQRPGKRVAMVDLDLQFGDVALFLNILPRTTIADAILDIDHLDEATVSSYLTSYNERFQVLAAPLRPEQAENVTGAHVGAVLSRLRSLYDYVVVDTAPSFDDTTIAALDAADLVLVVAALDLPTIKNIKIGLEIMQSLGYGEEKVQLVLNRANSEGGLDTHEVEASLRRQFLMAIPSDGKTIVNSVNKGLPFVVTHPETPAAQRIFALADKVAPQDIDIQKAAEKPARRFKFFG